MPSPRKPFKLPLEIKFAGAANFRELETCIQTYADALCAELGLSATPVVSLLPADQTASGPGDLFQISIGDRMCRPNFWPPLMLREVPSLQDYAELIGLALFDRKTLLLTRELVLEIAGDWGLRTESGAWNQGWSEDGFHHFLQQFPGAHFSLCHARRFIDRKPAGVASESGAAHLFEEAMELALTESVDLGFGVTVNIAEAEYSEHRSDYEGRLLKTLKGLSDDLGFLCREIRIRPGVLKLNEIQIGINEIRLPVIRGLARGKTLVLASLTDVRNLPVESEQLFISAMGLPIMSVSEADSHKLGNLKLWEADPPAYVEFLLRSIVPANAGSLLVSPTVHLLLQRLEAKDGARLLSGAANFLGEAPPLYRRLTVVLRGLLNEQVPVAELAAILESVCSLREIREEGRCSVYHFSESEDSPILVAERTSIRGLTPDDLIFAARLGVRALAVRDTDGIRQVLPVSTLPPDLQSALLSDGLSQTNRNRMVDWLGRQPSPEVGIVVDQRLRARIKDLLRFEFSSVPVFGSSEIPKALLASS